MITGSLRFHGHASLNQVYKRGVAVRGPQLALRYARNDRRRSYRAAVVVSRKVAKSAVVRNRIRRRMYEIIRLEISNNYQPVDLIFTAFDASLAELPTPTLQHLVRAQLRKAGVQTITPRQEIPNPKH